MPSSVVWETEPDGGGTSTSASAVDGESSPVPPGPVTPEPSTPQAAPGPVPRFAACAPPVGRPPDASPPVVPPTCWATDCVKPVDSCACAAGARKREGTLVVRESVVAVVDVEEPRAPGSCSPDSSMPWSWDSVVSGASEVSGAPRAVPGATVRTVSSAVVEPTSAARGRACMGKNLCSWGKWRAIRRSGPAMRTSTHRGAYVIVNGHAGTSA